MPKSVSISRAEGKPGHVYHPLSLDTVPKPEATGKQVIVKMHTAALNHKDVFTRQGLYPNIGFGVTQLADGAGTVVEVGPQADRTWLGKRVVICPGTGWESDPVGPEVDGKYATLGGSTRWPQGTLQEYMALDQTQLELAPGHLTDAEAAAFPLCGLTAWRAVMTKCDGHIGAGKKMLVTGIGGGVALCALQFAIAAGTEVYVTSGDERKIEKAQRLGAVGGVNYKDPAWEKRLMELMNNAKLDTIVDGAGGDIVVKATKILKAGGIISSYGMTLAPKVPFTMQAVMRNIEFKGSTMGSRKEFREMVRYVNDKKIKPVVSKVAKGLELPAIEELYDEMEKGAQFGKLVVEISQSSGNSKL